MHKKNIGCLLLILLFLLHFFDIIPSTLLLILDFFAIIFILPYILKGFFYKISHKLFLSYFLIGFVPVFASFILIISIVELGGVLYLQNQYDYSLRTWTLEIEKELLNLYLKPEPVEFFKLEKKYPKIKIKIKKEDFTYYFGCNENTIFLENNDWHKAEFVYTYKIGKDIILNVPLKEILKNKNFFNLDLEWAIISSSQGRDSFKNSGEKNILKKPLIYSVYFLNSENNEKNSYLLMRSSIYSIYQSLSKAQPVLSKEIVFVLRLSSIFLLFLTLLSFFYAGYFIYKSSKNISILTKGVDYFSSGKLDYRIDVKGKDELSNLAKNFNQMAESINLYISKLKEKAEEEKEIELASKIQRSLLPDEKEFSLFKEVKYYFLPSKGIGGDYFDIFKLKDNKIMVLIGDASGHGISASITMSLAKAIITSLIYRDTPMECFLQEIHSILIETGLKDQFLTLQIAEVDKENKTINFYSAGHPPAFFISKNGVTELRINSFPIGLFSGPGFDIISFKYEDGDSLIFYTDGLVETEDSNFGIKELKELIEKNLNEKEFFFQKLLEDMEDIYKGKNPIDDMTILFIKL